VAPDTPIDPSAMAVESKIAMGLIAGCSEVFGLSRPKLLSQLFKARKAAETARLLNRLDLNLSRRFVVHNDSIVVSYVDVPAVRLLNQSTRKADQSLRAVFADVQDMLFNVAL
jgi:hypothetical protein